MAVVGQKDSEGKYLITFAYLYKTYRAFRSKSVQKCETYAWVICGESGDLGAVGCE